VKKNEAEKEFSSSMVRNAEPSQMFPPAAGAEAGSSFTWVH
jgi:hypothetical protein